MANKRPTFKEIDAIMRPRSVAVVGASANPDTPGYDYVAAMQECGFSGAIYPVNPRGGEILGLAVAKSLAEVPGDVDYVISCIPSDHILDLVGQAAQRNVKAMQLFTGRFSETGREEDIELESRLREAIDKAGIRLIGPNCMGVLNPAHGMSFRRDMSHQSGGVGFLSQSGNLLFEITHFGEPRGLRFSKAVSYGNALDLDETDFIEYFARDPETKVIGAYVEGVRDGRRFLDALKRASTKKPVVVLKGGRTSAGGRAAASHTAALAGASRVWEAALTQSGALAVDTVEDLIDMLIAFSYMKKPLILRLSKDLRFRVGMVGAGGGRSVLTADLCEEVGLAVPQLPPDVEAKVAERAPDLAGWVTNPVDQSILAGSGLGGGQILEWFDESPEIDLLLANMNEAWAFGRPNASDVLPRIAERFAKIAGVTKKPFAVALGPSDYSDEARWRLVSETRDKLVAANVALFPSVERAVRALASFTGYWRRRKG
jgi:acyl-CoA synthetase (NDP forming)